MRGVHVEAFTVFDMGEVRFACNIYVSIYIYIYIYYIYIYVYINMYVYMYLYICAIMYIICNVILYLNIYVCIHTYIYIYNCVCIIIYIYLGGGKAGDARSARRGLHRLRHGRGALPWSLGFRVQSSGCRVQGFART